MISKKDLMSRLESEHSQWRDDYDFEQIMGDIEDFPESEAPDNNSSDDIEFTAHIITEDPEGEVVFNHVSKKSKEDAERAITWGEITSLKSKTGETVIIRSDAIRYASFLVNKCGGQFETLKKDSND